MKSLLIRLRTAVFTWLLMRTAKVAGPGCRANGRVRAANLYLGKDCHFNGMKVYGSGKVEVGDHFHSGTGLEIMTTIHNYHGKMLPYDETVIVKDVVIGKNVWIGMDVMILGGVTIGDGAIIQARSVVARSIPPLAIAGGHPAVPFSERDAGHYRALAGDQQAGESGQD